MIRATLSLALVVLAGIAGVWWTARYLDPLRALERMVPARVRTVDLSGSGPFVQPRSDTAPAVQVPVQPAPRLPAAPPEPPPPTAPAEETAVATLRLAPRGDFSEGPAAGPATPAATAAPSQAPPPPHDPDASAELIRRMLSLYPSAGDSP